MTIKVGINGFGRIGRLALRESFGSQDLEVVHINECAGDAKTAAHLLQFDSIHGVWQKDIAADEQQRHLSVEHARIGYSQCRNIVDTPWAEAQVDLILECTGQFKTMESLTPFFDQNIQKVVVSAPIKGYPEEQVLNVVMGVNDTKVHQQNIVTAASCTTNCLAPVIDVLHSEFGIIHGSMTTIHDITNTQSVLDQFHSDPRRARASSLSLIPTSTGSATAITEIFPELKGRLNGMAVRVPMANASLTDCVFELGSRVTAAEVNQALSDAAQGRLKGILGYEDRPLVSVDYTNDRRSGIVDGLSTMVIDGTQVKVLIWYDNEVGYVNRMIELAAKVARSIG
jgi:glyceraldehyde 3-phosphate dehydrogenase